MGDHTHAWRFDGDDPYVICDCGARQDAITGRVISTGHHETSGAEAADSGLPASDPTHDRDTNSGRGGEPSLSATAPELDLDAIEARARILIAFPGDGTASASLDQALLLSRTDVPALIAELRQQRLAFESIKRDRDGWRDESLARGAAIARVEAQCDDDEASIYRTTRAVGATYRAALRGKS